MNNPDSSTSVSTSQNGGRSMLRIPLSTLGYISSILSLVVFISGFITGYVSIKAQMDTVNGQLSTLGSRVGAIDTSASADRQSITNRLTGLETETRYIKEGIAEIRLMNIPKK